LLLEAEDETLLLEADELEAEDEAEEEETTGGV